VLHEHHLIIRVGAGLIQFVYGSHSRMAADLTLDKNLDTENLVKARAKKTECTNFVLKNRIYEKFIHSISARADLDNEPAHPQDLDTEVRQVCQKRRV